jgi:hypothetical protein
MTNGTRRGWGVSITHRPLFTPGKRPVPIVQEAGWAPGPVWTGGENLAPSGFDPRTVEPVASRYTDCATRPVTVKKVGKYKIKYVLILQFFCDFTVVTLETGKTCIYVSYQNMGQIWVVYEIVTCKCSVVIFNSSDKPLCVPGEYCGAARGDWNFPENSSSC